MGSEWPLLLIYGSHDMRHTSFPQVDGGQRDPRNSGRHKFAPSPFYKFVALALMVLYQLESLNLDDYN